MISEKKLSYPKAGYRPVDYSYTVSGYSHYCRESFENDYKNHFQKEVHFKISNDTTLERVHDNFMFFERKLSLNDGETIFGKTEASSLDGFSIDNIIWIKPNEVWLGDCICRSLFTLLLRACAKSNQADYDTIIGKEYCLYETKMALEIFLDGYTKIDFKPDGYYKHLWNHYFRGKTKEELEKLLVKP